MKNLLTFLLLTTLVSLLNKLDATKYYFSSSTGDDSRTSTQAQNPSTPWKTLSKLNSFFSSIQPGDSILFLKGDTFYGSISVSKSGTSSAYINFGAYGSGANPVISGLTTISSWISLGGNLYSSVIPGGLSNLNMVVVNGIFQPIGRWPKTTATNGGYLTINSTSSATSVTSTGLSGALDLTGGEIVFRKNHWVLDRETILTQLGTTVTFSNNYPAYTVSSGWGFFFQNSVNACTSQGDWAYNTISHTITMYSSNTPSGVQASTLDNLITISGRSYITFSGLDFIGSNSSAFVIVNASYISVNNCNFNWIGTNAIDGSNGITNYFTLKNCTISNVNNNGLNVHSGTNWDIENNVITNIAMNVGMGQSSDGQYMAASYIGSNSTVKNNEWGNIGYTAIYYAGTNIKIQNNYVHDFCVIKDDGAGIYTYGNNNSGTVVSGNIVMNAVGSPNGTTGGSWAEGIYTDDRSNNLIISGNTVANGCDRGIYVHNSHEIQIFNNTCFSNNNSQIEFFHDNIAPNDPIRNINLKGNILVSKTSSQTTSAFSTISNDVLSFGIADSNYYSRPIKEPTTLSIPGTNNTLAGWQTYSGQDVHSKISPKTIANVNDLRFEYNATSSNKVVNLGATYISIDSIIHVGSITLPPYSSVVLIYLSGTVSNQSPIANAGPDQSITLPTNSITVIGSGTDPDGSIASYQWTKISGPSQFTIVSPTQAQTVINNLAQGVYLFQLTVTDNLGATGKDTVQITVNPAPNQAPTANAGLDQNITLPTNNVTLVGSGNDPDGNIASYQWTKISGPTQFTIVSPTQAQTTINNLAQGVYQFQLTVTDNQGATGKDTVAITINAAPNQAPTANAGLDQNITLPTNSVTLVGSGSDPDGNIASYQWTKISGPTQFTIVSPTQAQTAINNLAQGVYQFQLAVTDNQGATGKDTVKITVNPANIPPTVNAGPDQNITLPTTSVTLIGSGSDPDGSIASYQWTKISGPSQFNIVSSTQAQTVINNLSQGVYQFQLTVTDNQGATGKDTVVITVNPTNQSPTANAGLDQSITLPTNNVTLVGSGIDPDGTIFSYAWTKISGPSQFSIVSPTQAQTVVNNLAQGTYQFQLTVTDNQGATGKDTVVITVNPPNQPPSANAGPDQSITLPTNSLTLVGSGNDPDGSIASYQWAKISGPSQYTIVSPTQAQTVINNLAQGVYQFQLMVTDNQGATEKDTVVITVNPINQSPTANAGPDQSITLPTNSLTLVGSGNDPDGSIASYQWAKISGPSQFTIVSPSQAQTVVNNLAQGTYQFQLTVTDNQGATGKDTVVITVNPPNQPPTANAGPDQSITLPTNSLTLVGSGNDPDGSIASYQWAKISGPSQFTIVSPSQAQTVVNNLAQGTYQFQLTVTDNQGAIGKDTVVITVNAANQPPTANAGPNQNITLPTDSVTLLGSGNDPDGTIVSYAWAKISGPSQFNIVSPSQAQTVVSNLAQGTYQFQLTVTDNQGATGTSTVTVTVNAAPNQPPIAYAGPDQSITLPTNSITLTGSGSDPDGTIIAYRWRKISGPNSGNIANISSATTTVTGLVQGVYKYELRVQDNSGAYGRDTMQVTVNPANIPPTANAGSNQNITLPTDSVSVSGSGTDPDGAIVSYSWTEVSGPSQYTIVSSTQAQTIINNLVQGTYQFQLTVTDNSGATGSDIVVITVNASPNQPPVANAGPNQNITLPTDSVTLVGTGNDPDGNVTSYQWTKVSGPTQYNIVSPSQAQTVINNLVQGTYQFQLTVTDDQGATGIDIVIVTVNTAPNQPPTANAGNDQTITLPTNSVNLVGSGNDSDGTIVSYQWSKISGPTQFTIVSPFQAQTTINNLVQGTYQFQLTVTDNSGATGTDVVIITVNPAPNQAPTANAGSDININLPTNSVTLVGSGNDPDGSISSYQWTKILGPSQYNIVSSTQAQTVINNLVQGIYQFQLTVTDNQGAAGKDTVTVTVNPANIAPTANAGPDQIITLPTNSVTLFGSGNDPDGNIASYQWTKISGPSQYNIASSTQAQTVINNLVQGVYQFQLTVTDNQGATGKDTVKVTVNPANIPPTANTGPDQSITLPTNNVTLFGSGNDPDGSIASYQWTKISGPSQYNIVSPTQAQTVINNLVQGTYQFQLTVTDNQGATGIDTVKVTVNPANIPPTANAGPDRSITLPTNTVIVFGSGNDPDGSIASYQWTKISGPSQYNIVSPTQAQTVINNLVQGVYQFVLTVTDNQGATGKDTVQVTVLPANVPPTANAGPNENITLPTNSVTLFGSGNDPDGSISSYQWTKISGPSQYNIVSPTQAQTVINNLVQGIYQFVLTVTDNQGATGKDTVQVTVNPSPNQPPIANAGPNQNITLPNNSVTLVGSGSDPDGNIASYQWTKISGPSQYNIVSPAQAQTVINNLMQGVYQFVLTVTDNQGATGKDTVQVTVNPAPNQPPTANAGLNQNITLPTNNVTLVGSGSDPDGNVVSYQWTKISGPSQYNIVSPAQAQTVINNLVQGVYQFVLTVTDNQGATGKDTVQVTVNPAPNQPPTANAGPNQNITLPTNSVTLVGSGSDPDGNIVSYQWTKISGPSQYNIVSPSQAQTVINNLVQGVYQFQLTVIDNNGATGKDTVQVTVNPVPNQPPTANAGPDQNITLPTNSVTLSGSGHDPDGIIVFYSWRQIAGPTQFTIVSPNSAQTVINNLVQGLYEFQLTVTDNSGATGTDIVAVSVNAAQNPPTANAGNDQTIALPTNSVILSGTGNSPNGTVTSYSWSQVSGPGQSTIVSATQTQTLVQNLVEGVYQFELSATDNNGLVGKDTVQVTVEPIPNRNQISSSAKLYPNPASDVINIEIDGATQKSSGYINIYNSAGRVVYQESFNRDQFTVTKQIDVSSFAGGIYFVSVTIDANTQTTLKFVKE